MSEIMMRPCGGSWSYCDGNCASCEKAGFTVSNSTTPTKTNADHIRSMSDEELAWELMLWRCEAVAKHHGVSSEYPDTQQTIFDWLKQPYEEANHGKA